MTIGQHLAAFGGLPVKDADDAKGSLRGVAVRIATEYGGGPWTDAWETFLARRDVGDLEGLVVGSWGEAMSEGPGDVVEAIVAATPFLPKLKVLFVGDMTFEECEISWINQGNLTPLLRAFPSLRAFGCRGGQGLVLGPVSHANLETLVVETGGLPGSVVRSIASSTLPKLKNLELWLGSSEYGGDTTVAHLTPILRGLFPALERLALRDAEDADGIAKALVSSVVLGRVRELDLSMGTLGDDGAVALLGDTRIKNLRKLSIRHHYCSDDVVARLKGLGIDVDAGDPEGPAPPDDRYVEVAE